MRWMKWYILVMIALVALYMLAEYNRPKTIDWTPTYSNRDKIPYGTYIVFNELKNYFNGLAPKEQVLPLYDHVNNSDAENELYLLVNNSASTTETDEDELYKYIERGNTVFIATEEISNSFEKKFKVSIDRFTSFALKKDDSATINFANPLLKATKDYALQKDGLESHFDKADTAHSTILGVNNYGQANFIRIKIGKGSLLLHTIPKAFTNFFVLKDNNIEYSNKVFSYLPQKPSALYWDVYYNQGRTDGADTPLRVILTKPNLRWAYYTALLSMLVYILFQLKRRQRIIPVVLPPKNDSKEFVETVSRVYYNQKHHLNIANKKINYWLDFVRTRFGISTKELNDEFVNNLSHRSGVGKNQVNDIVNIIGMCRVRPAISTEELLHINQLIDNFYKQA
jgi:hypothetical protein